jgi:hypothetical protein
MRVQPSPTREALPSTHVLDLLAVLLHYYASAGRPSDGVVPFDQATLVRDAGWVKPGKEPSGRHYHQLADALWHLQHTTMWWTGDNVPDPAFSDHSPGDLSISVLSAVRLGRARPGRRPRARAAAGGSVHVPSSWVEFGRTFANLLRCEFGTVSFDLEQMLALPSGTARALFRTLCWYRHRGMHVIPLRELYPRIGSVEQRLTPSRAKQVLGAAHAALVDTGILLDLPNYEWCRPPNTSEHAAAELCVVYPFTVRSAAFLSAEHERLVRTARLLGVSEPMAFMLLNYGEQFRTVLDAIGEGDVSPRDTPAYIVDATRYGWNVSRKSRPSPAPHPALDRAGEARPVAERYADWLQLQVGRFFSRPDVDAFAIQAEAAERLRWRNAVPTETPLDQDAIWREEREMIRERLALPTLDEYAANPAKYDRRAR